MKEALLAESQKFKSNVFAIHAGFNGNKKFFDELNEPKQKKEAEPEEVQQEWRRLAARMQRL